MDDLNRMMHLNGLNKSFRRRLREYLHQSKHLQIARASERVVDLLSPLLQEEAVLKTNRHWLAHLWFLKDTEPGCAVQIAMSVKPIVFVPAENPPNNSLYVINRGAVLFNGRLLTWPAVWGHDVILASERFRSEGVAFSMTYLETYSLTYDALMTVGALYHFLAGPVILPPNCTNLSVTSHLSACGHLDRRWWLNSPNRATWCVAQRCCLRCAGASSTWLQPRVQPRACDPRASRKFEIDQSHCWSRQSAAA